MLANVCRQECTRHKLHIGLVFIAIMIEIVACPWPGDVLILVAQNNRISSGQSTLMRFACLR